MPFGRIRSEGLHGQYVMRKTTPGCRKQPGVVLRRMVCKGEVMFILSETAEILMEDVFYNNVWKLFA